MNYWRLDIDREHNFRDNLLRRAISKWKLKHYTLSDAIDAAAALSTMSTVLGVTIVLVQEQSVGIWRKGVKTA